MNFLSKMYCRSYQAVCKMILPFVKFREPKSLKNMYELKDTLKDNSVVSVLIVSGIKVKELGLTSPLEEILKSSNIVANFYSFSSDPTIQNIHDASEIYSQNNCQAIIAFGGGSIIDCAKIVGAKISNGEKSVEKMKGLFKIKKPLPLLFALPTTAGSGSDASPSAVINHNNAKLIITDIKLIPSFVLLDEKLTATLPADQSAICGMDALTHAIEAFLNNTSNNYSRKCALDACLLIFENILKVYADGTNLRARKHMLQASYLAGVAFSRSFVGYTHAISHSLSSAYNIPHGLANAVILPYVISEYGNSISSKLKVLAVYCNIAKSYDHESLAATKFINRLFELNSQLGIPSKLKQIVIEDIPALAKIASREANPLYPVPKLLSAKELTRIYYQARENTKA